MTNEDLLQAVLVGCEVISASYDDPDLTIRFVDSDGKDGELIVPLCHHLGMAVQIRGTTDQDVGGELERKELQFDFRVRDWKEEADL